MSESQAFMEYAAAVRRETALNKERDDMSRKLADLAKRADEAKRAVADAQNKLYRVLAGEG